MHIFTCKQHRIHQNNDIYIASLSYCHKILDILKSTLQQESIILLDWFGDNQMQANPDKFQFISVGKKTCTEMKSIKVADVNITCEESVKLLGVELDYKLDFDNQNVQKSS